MAPAGAHAHFVLKAPANWVMQDSLGGPQKMGPCGNEGPQTPSNAITPFQPGDQVTIQLDETIFHPGHYRVSLAATPNNLPPEPVVTPSAGNQCASAAVQMNPTLPVLADNLLVHTAPFSGTQSVTVTLPTNPPCTNCVLQVLEFMSSHGAPCFYHHCANITIGGSSDAAAIRERPIREARMLGPGHRPPPRTAAAAARPRAATDTSFGGLAAFALAIAALRRARRR